MRIRSERPTKVAKGGRSGRATTKHRIVPSESETQLWDTPAMTDCAVSPSPKSMNPTSAEALEEMEVSLASSAALRPSTGVFAGLPGVEHPRLQARQARQLFLNAEAATVGDDRIDEDARPVLLERIRPRSATARIGQARALHRLRQARRHQCDDGDPGQRVHRMTNAPDHGSIQSVGWFGRSSHCVDGTAQRCRDRGSGERVQDRGWTAASPLAPARVRPEIGFR